MTKCEFLIKALIIFEFCAKNDRQIHTVWIPSEQNTQTDYLSRIIDIDDWAISTEFFQFIDELWGPHSVDRLTELPFKIMLATF
jgi:hypothetical protein